MGYNDFIIYLWGAIKEKGSKNEMSYKKGLINRISNLLLIIETPENQSIIRKSWVYLNVLRDYEKEQLTKPRGCIGGKITNNNVSRKKNYPKNRRI